VGLLGRFRAALRDEIEEEGSSLDETYEARLFGYIDKLNADRVGRLRAGADEGPGEGGGATGGGVTGGGATGGEASSGSSGG